VVAVGSGSSFLGFFLKRPLKALFTWSMASGAGKKCISDAGFEVCGNERDSTRASVGQVAPKWETVGRCDALAYQVAKVKIKGNLRTPGMMIAIDGVLGGGTN
jgi:hypothetical protein